MKIVVWNAHQAFSQKQSALLKLSPDVAIIPECGSDIDSDNGRAVWVGANKSKGLAVVSYGDYRLTKRHYDHDIRWIVPVSVTGPHNFLLLAVWNMYPYHEVEKALATYHRLLSAGPAVAAGDFNVRPESHQLAKAPWQFFLGDTRLISAYHKVTHEEPWYETRPTHYWLYRADERFHYDYCFVPDSWRLNSVRVGSFKTWVQSGLSDHVPLVVDVSPTS